MFTLLLLTASTAFARDDWKQLSQDLLRNGSCLLIGINLAHDNTSIIPTQSFIDDQEMLLIESPFEKYLRGNGETAFLEVTWTWSYHHIIEFYLASFHAFVQDSVKKADQCAVLLNADKSRSPRVLNQVGSSPINEH